MKSRNKSLKDSFMPEWCGIQIGTIIKYNESKKKGVVVGFTYPIISVLTIDNVIPEDIYELDHQYRILII